MTALDTPLAPAHPARWSKPILAELDRILFDEAAARPGPLTACDPFAGVGLAALAALQPGWSWVGCEIEPEWAGQSPGTLAADACRAPFRDRSVDVLVTSPTYGNRMADGYDGGRDTCTNCGGSGRSATIGEVALLARALAGHPSSEVWVPCRVCSGSGFAPSVRRTYRISLGRDLTPGNSGALKWAPGRAGKPYRALHAAAWREAWRYLAPGALVVVNVSNRIATVGPKHDRRRVEMHVAEWHLSCWLRLGARLEASVPVKTSRFGFGQNGQSRTEHEWLFVLRKPPTPELVNPPTKEQTQ